MSIELKTVSDGFLSQISENEGVIAALFTTYRFEPEFFEQEIIPLILDQNLAFSSDQRIKSIQVREALSEAGLPIEVFYDVDLFRQQGTVSPSMEYLHHGIRGERGALHAKLIFLLVKDIESGEQSLCVGSGSANLTIAGWWENVECMHWEWIIPGQVRERFLNQLRNDISWLESRRTGVGDNSSHALPQIASFLKQCKASNSAPFISYYGLSSLSLAQKRRPAFMKFLLDALNEQSPNYRRWTLEIISPYFADSPEFDAHRHFFKDLGVEQIRLFLPMNDQGEALCQREYYEKIAGTEGIEWADWSSDIAKSLVLNSVANRTTHAKVYHFYNGMQSWVFVGSVNFTHRAIRDNQEAGFFTRLPAKTTLLTPVKTEPDKWVPKEQLVESDAGKIESKSVPDLVLNYDWKLHELSAQLRHIDSEYRDSVNIDILTPEGNPVVENIHVLGHLIKIECEPVKIESLLKTSGFLRVRGEWSSVNEAFPERDFMVQQIHWTHKPNDLPHLTPQEIMQIYAGLSSIRRNQLIEYLKQRQLREIGLLGESSGSTEYSDQGRQFFSEYAELFHAFRNLRRRLSEAWVNERLEQVDYYLSGRGIDSLPTLFESITGNKENDLDNATVYLTLLCMIQVYQQPEYSSLPDVKKHLALCRERLNILESSGKMSLIDDDPARKKRFFEWYKEHFFREYRAVNEEDVHEAD